jgi:hypothetical protein
VRCSPAHVKELPAEDDCHGSPGLQPLSGSMLRPDPAAGKKTANSVRLFKSLLCKLRG